MARASSGGLSYVDGVHGPAGPLSQPIATVAPRLRAKFEQLGIRTTGDLARHYPHRYADPSTLTDIASLVVGENVSVVAEVRSASLRFARSNGSPRVEAEITDGTSVLQATFFAKARNKAEWFATSMRRGRRGLFTGKVAVFNGRAQLTNPKVDWFDRDVDEGDHERLAQELVRPTPVYPATAGLEQSKIATTVRLVVEPLRDDDVDDPLPDEVRTRHGLVGLRQALQDVHLPRTEDDWRRARRRLRFEEAFVLQAELARRRARAAAQPATARPLVADGLLDRFDAQLPFALTGGQREVGRTIAEELARPTPMQRLLQGEVGSGKTVVALRAMLQVVDAGGQAALLAPTEVLAAQHARSLRALLGDLAEGGMLGGADVATRVALVTASMPAQARRAALLDAASGAAGIVVGTHALLYDKVQLADLGLVVVDEQHRFGVEQRDALRAKARTEPHLLVMTATPIPRTVAMTVFGDLETSVLRELPAGRAGITTHVVPAARPGWLDRAWARVREEVDRGGRAYVVCARIADDDAGAGSDDEPGTDERAGGDQGDERTGGATSGAARGTGRGGRGSETDGADLVLDQPATVGDAQAPRRPARSVLETAAELRSSATMRGIAIGVLHGRMSPEDKEAALAAFASGRSPVLVSTTVVEVGVDVPEATVMVVLDADRFGVSQLHQLRGRVGRGSAPGLCLLVSGAPEGSPGDDRVAMLARSGDGFELAAFDLEQRGEGDVLGASQSGGTSLRLLRVTRDADLIEKARQDARALVDADPELTAWPALRGAIDQLLVGGRQEYIDRA